MNELAEAINNAIKDSQSSSGSDYTAKVMRVEGQTAYVQITGSDIADTPIAMSVNCRPGDMVRVRVSDGKAWITGNDTLPPSNESKEVGTKMAQDMSDRDRDIVIDFGTFTFNGNTLIIHSKNFTLDKNGNAVFAGTLEAANGTFKGNLNAAKGSFEGTLDFMSTESDYHTSIDDDGISVMIPASGGIPQMSTVIIPEEVYCWYGDPSDPSAIGHRLDANGVHDVSDLRLKTDIVDLTPDLAKQLRPVQFRFKIDDKTRYGFIAQDVQKVLPDAVSKSKNGYLMLNYTEIIAPLTALVQQQEERITQLEARLKALEDQING